MSEGKHGNEIAFMLVATMGELAAKLFAENDYYCMSELNGNFTDSDERVSAESCRQTVIYLFVIESFLDINVDLPPPADCTGFDSAPLPCSEKLWKQRREHPGRLRTNSVSQAGRKMGFRNMGRSFSRNN